jgi:hypothetical protein
MGSAFLYRDWVRDAVFVGDVGAPAIASLPLSNLLDAQPRVRTRWIPAEASVYVDFGAPREVSCVALIGTTFGTTAGFPIGPNVRVRVGPDAGFGASEWDSGFVSVDTAVAWNGNIVILHPSSVTGRYMRVDIDNSTDAYLDIGRIVAGPLWRVRYGYAYGAAEGRLILDRRERNGHTGAEFAVPAVNNPRLATFTLPLLAESEVTGEWRQMRDSLGAVGDAIWIPDTGATQAEINARALFGAVQRPGESLVTRANFAGSTRTFSIVERV